MPGLTAKVFRTYNASYTMGSVLKEIKTTGSTIAEKVKAYNDANRKVAILCNHKRTVTAGHANAMEKMGERVSRNLPDDNMYQKLTHLPTDQGSPLSEVASEAANARLGPNSEEEEGRCLLRN
jgi:hypothetical protein